MLGSCHLQLLLLPMKPTGLNRYDTPGVKEAVKTFNLNVFGPQVCFEYSCLKALLISLSDTNKENNYCRTAGK